MIEHDDDYVFGMVDRGLTSYIPDQEPIGLDRRILRNIQQDNRSRQQRNRRLWVLGLAFASICLVIATTIATRLRPSHPAQVQSIKTGPPSFTNGLDRKTSRPVERTATASRRAVTPAKLTVLRRTSKRPRSLPKLDRFPAATPLTAEERALLRLPPAVAASLFANQHGADLVSINIEPLRIDPL